MNREKKRSKIKEFSVVRVEKHSRNRFTKKWDKGFKIVEKIKR